MEDTKQPHYRIQIDEELLRSLFLHPIPEITKQEIREVFKVAELIFTKYFRKYGHLKKDLKYGVMTAVLKRHANFDPQYRAYNYIYTIARNEMGNLIKKLSKEALLEDLAPDYDIGAAGNIPAGPNGAIAHRLGGDFEAGVMTIPEADIYSTLLFIEKRFCAENGGGIPEERVATRLLELLM